MPSITNQETVDAIAQEYCTNGLIKSKALKAVGYTNRYAETRGLKLYDNVRVKPCLACSCAYSCAGLVAFQG